MIPANLWAEIAPAFAAGYPCEVGVVVERSGAWRVLANTSGAPEASFSMSDANHAALSRLHRKGELLAFLHSHPKGSREPSDRDYQSQMDTGWTWGIVGVRGDPKHGVYEVYQPEYLGAHLDRGPLEGRPYLWGVRDCFNLVLDYFRAQGIELPDSPRIRHPSAYPSTSWQRRYFEQWLERGPCRRVNRTERQPGDAFVFYLNGDRPAHCGVYLGEGRYLHHPRDKTSLIEIWPDEERTLMDWSAVFYRHDPEGSR